MVDFSIQLQDSNFSLNPTSMIWSRTGYRGIDYSDGDAIEERLLTIIDNSRDISVLSSELRSKVSDWPSLYHLSSRRANLLRPMRDALKGDILEIGAGCGAITRYLGESGANVLALEGSPRRATIARSRTRDLPNVTVVTERFENFELNHKFDVITLIGVLEYSALFTSGQNPSHAMLESIRRYLKPDGIIVIAIENQFGLKYLSGFHEDHHNKPMYGIEGKYQHSEARTWGKKSLSRILNKSGFSHQKYFACFPDYKLPTTIISSAGFDSDKLDCRPLIWQAAASDPQHPGTLAFSSPLAWPEIIENGLGMEMANSFLLVGKLEPFEDNRHSSLAWHYSTDRRPHFCKETLFTVGENREISVRCSPIAPNISDDEPAQILQQSISPTAEYHPGNVLSFEFHELMNRDDWRIPTIADFMKKYALIVESLATKRPIDSLSFATDRNFPGDFFDCIPGNIVCLSAEEFRFIDQEWSTARDISLKYLVFRSLLSLTGNLTSIGSNPIHPRITRREFIKLVLRECGYQISEQEWSALVADEVKFQSIVSGTNTSQTSLDKFLEMPLHPAKYWHVIESQRQQISFLQRELENIINSRKWRILVSITERIPAPFRRLLRRIMNFQQN